MSVSSSRVPVNKTFEMNNLALYRVNPKSWVLLRLWHGLVEMLP